MKHNLGKIYLLFCIVLLHAEDFSYSFHVDKQNPYVKEAVILTLELNQTNPDVVLLFNFDLVNSKNYSFRRLDIRETDEHPTQGLHNAHLLYTYLIYPLRAGELNLKFKLLKKVTSNDSVAYSFSGDRDNVKGLVTTDTQIPLPPLSLRIKDVPQGTQIVGDFTLDYHFKKHQADAHEPLPFQVTLKGLGYPPLLATLLPKDVNFTHFTEKPLAHRVTSPQGTDNTVTYPMALSHSKSFTLASISLKAFNPQSQKSYTLTVPAQHFEIKAVDVKSLVDKVNSPKVLKTDWSWLENMLTYVLIFSGGYLTARFLTTLGWKWRKKVHTKDAHPLKEKIQNCKESKALLQVLLAHDSHHFSTVIATLENSLYGDGKINLSKVKEEAMDMI